MKIEKMSYSGLLAYELLAYLKFLTLVGYQDGEFMWTGTEEDWNNAQSEIDCYEHNNLERSDIDYWQEVLS